MSPSVTVMLASANQQLANAVEAILAVTSDIHLVGAARDVRAVMSALGKHQPRILTVDLTLPEAGIPLRLARLGKRETEGLRVLTIDNRFDEAQAVRMAKAGAHGYMSVDAVAIHLETAIRRLAAGEAWFSRKLEGSIVDELHRLSRSRLWEG